MKPRTLLFPALCLLLSLPLCAQDDCEVATSLVEVSWNQISARFNHSRADFTDEFAFGPAFEFPAGEGTHAMYASGFVFSGMTADGQVRASVQLYAGDTDFAPGPISMGDVATWAASCEEYDRFWLITRQAVDQHLAYFDCLGDPACDVDVAFPDGYTIPDDFLSWPAHGDLTLAQSFNLAPFYDYDLDGLYDPLNGDCPLFAAYANGCETALQGDVSLYWIENDRRLFNDASSSSIEVHNTVFAYVEGEAGASPYDRTLFHQRTVYNRGIYTLSDARFGAFVDPDLGNPSDDYVGMHVENNTAYVYNGDALDETTFTPGYEDTPPAVGYQLIRGPLADFDEQDNDDNGIIDDERLGAGSFMVAPAGNLSTDVGAFSLMHSTWPDGSPLFYADTEVQAQFMYPGSSDPNLIGTGGVAVEPWSEVEAGNPPGDRAFVLATESFTFAPQDQKTFTVAYICHAFDDNPWATVGELMEYAEDLSDDFEDCTPTSVGMTQLDVPLAVDAYPNPTTGLLTVSGLRAGAYVEVLNLTGQIVHQQQTSGALLTLDLEQLPSGMYVVRCSQDHGSGSVRVIKE